MTQYLDALGLQTFGDDVAVLVALLALAILVVGALVFWSDASKRRSRWRR